MVKKFKLKLNDREHKMTIAKAWQHAKKMAATQEVWLLFNGS